MSFENPSPDSIPPQESGPQPKTREEIVSALRDRGIEDPEVLESLRQYQRTLELLSYTAEEGQDENFRVAIHMAEIYFESGVAEYQAYAIESLYEIAEANVSLEIIRMVHEALSKMEGR